MSNETFPLQKNAYITFDALTLKSLLQQRLTQDGVFTDQIYEGSNIAQLINVVSYTFNTLIYYLNRTSTESMFSDSILYENMNRIVKILGYSPIGNQTSVLTFKTTADETIPNGLFTIPRYSYVNIGPYSYSFNEDITFSKTLSGQAEYLQDISEQKLLYQGRYFEYPEYTAIGEENELISLLPGDNVILDHFNIDVYVKDVNTEKWEKWQRTNALYLDSASDKKFEIRLNENYHYEIKFGNNINGKKLNENDKVMVYYLKSDGKDGEVGLNALQSGKLIKYSTTRFNEIISEIFLDNGFTVIADTYTSGIDFDNESSSTYYSQSETVEEIKNNAPAAFRSQYRLITETDFENYIKTNFSNLVHDVKIVNNASYLGNYIKYFYDLGITNPNNVSRVLFNQVHFADSCNFNNVYGFIVPKTVTNTKTQVSYLSPALKEMIISTIKNVKVLTSEFITVDPVFVANTLCLTINNTIPTMEDANNTELYIIKEDFSRRDSNAIITDVNKIFTDYFNRNNVLLGQIIDITSLTNQILSIDGVKTFYTRRKDDPTVVFNGLSLLVWNETYSNDLILTSKNITLPYFKLPYLFDKETFTNKIIVSTSTQIYQSIEY